MRLWSLHPHYLDRRGLVTLWREALLAQAVLLGRTKGYRNHPQLDRFRTPRAPAAAHIGAYLRVVHAEAVSRGYSFAAGKINRARTSGRLTVGRGQLEYEWRHLRRKLETRDPAWLERLGDVTRPRAHPLFRVRAGGVATWERLR
jgi:hypothetical protein